MSEHHNGAYRIEVGDKHSESTAACRKILLVGEDNPISMDPRYALYHEPNGCSGHRLQRRVFGLDARRHYLALWRTNLCVGGWDQDMAEERAEQLMPPFPWTVIVLLGKKVAKAAGRALGTTIPAMDVHHASGVAVVSLPHPSGRNPVWGSKGVIEQARRLMTSVAPEIPWGELDR
jgi:hypothetical protein